MLASIAICLPVALLGTLRSPVAEAWIRDNVGEIEAEHGNVMVTFFTATTLYEVRRPPLHVSRPLRPSAPAPPSLIARRSTPPSRCASRAGELPLARRDSSLCRRRRTRRYRRCSWGRRRVFGRSPTRPPAHTSPPSSRACSMRPTRASRCRLSVTRRVLSLPRSFQRRFRTRCLRRSC